MIGSSATLNAKPNEILHAEILSDDPSATHFWTRNYYRPGEAKHETSINWIQLLVYGIGFTMVYHIYTFWPYSTQDHICRVPEYSHVARLLKGIACWARLLH